MEIKATLQKPYDDTQRMDFIVQYNHGMGYVIEETETELQAWGYTEEELNDYEKQRIQELSMTRSDFFDGTIQAWGVGQDELLVLIQALLATLPLPDVKKLIAINNYKNALNFYRKHDLFKMLVGMPIKLGDNIQLVIEDEHLDKFFDEVNKGNKETAWQYLPSPVMIPVEVEDETESNTTNEPTDISV